MKIETLESLLKQKNPGARAYSPGEMLGTKKSAVCVVFAEGGKVYEYQDSIYRVAERLGLIPEFDIDVEAEKAVEALSQGKSYITTTAAWDTIRYYGEEKGIFTHDPEEPWKTNLVVSDRCLDEYDREICRYSLG